MLQPRKIQALPFHLKQDQAFARTAQAVGLTMLKRFSSLILALVIGSSVLAGTVRPSDAHICNMASMEMTPGMHMDHDMEAMPGAEPMPCCKKHMTRPALSEPGSGEQCCVNIPQEPGSSETTFNLRPPSFSIAVIHPAIVQSPIILPKPYECSYSPQVFLPNLQSSYVRNLSILI
jgi:hypothetical protein